MAKCALCGNQIDKEHPFTDPESHKKGCPIWADSERVVEVIRGVVDYGDGN